ncbi:60S ribosomal protein L14-like [Centruroides sculpturatus]|uniref:Large ribosomal subunit protein eL14 n=1 Tax=Centruroides hentzi TaxID=88313 RepID=A0A2I9LPK8_9SCOR|nr:60S ribosomal protein L14-like [Centruroides sculpturatus]
MAFRHFVQIGRVAYVPFGTNAGKLCVIVDIIDQNRALVDGPCSGVTRQSIQFKKLRLTKFRIKIPHSTSTKTVRKAWEKENISEKWKETPLAKKIEARKKRVNMNDFDRFKLYKAKQLMNREIRTAFLKLKATAKKNPPKPRPKRVKKLVKK